MSATPGDVVGREQELAALADFLAAREGLPGAILLEGEAGIGKTTLWRRGLELASRGGYRVLSSRPSRSEAQLSFAALGDLLEHVRDDDAFSALPQPQRRAVAVALFLEEAQGPPDQRAIALAFLGVVRALGQAGPVAIALDDLQWLDGPSAFVLEFALRRLREEPVAFLVAVRSSGTSVPLALERVFGEERLLRLVVGPLSLGALHRLLNDRLGLVLSRPKLRRLHELSSGNPFFALELGRAVGRGAIRLEPGESLPGTLTSLIHDRLAALPDGTRTGLLAASAMSQPTLELVGRAAGGDAEERLAPAFAAQVIELEEDRIRFAHPLLASGVYAAAGVAERQALHRRLARLVPDPEERARQLALGVEGSDASVATALEQAAREAHSRGAFATAAELSEQARRLTPLELKDELHERAIQAAAYAFEAGESGRTRALLEDALTAAPVGRQRAQVLYWLGVVQAYEGDRRRAVELYRSALLDAGNDAALRARLEDGLAGALMLMRKDLPAAAAHARAAVVLAERIGDESAHMAGLACAGTIAALRGRPAWRATLERGVGLERKAERVRLADSASFCLAAVLTWVDELDEARTIFRSLRERADEQAEESALPWTLAQLGLVEFLAGRWAEASQYAEEGTEIALQTGQEPQRLFALGVRALVRACRGEVEGARADAASALAFADERGAMIASILASSALGLLELSLERPEAAHRVLGPLGERLEQGGVREPGSARFAADTIEALIGLGRLEEAELLLGRLERRARRLDRASALAAAWRCRGLLAAARGDLADALASLARALTEHERVPMPFERARSLLVLGQVRRRARMKRPARESFEEALAIFEGLGARLWTERARAELARIGGRPPATGDLTSTERRVAGLVAQGRSNKEVAAALFVTVKTVERSLSRIYSKLGVRSRTQLAQRLATENRGEAASKL